MTVQATPLHPDAGSALRDRLTQMQIRVSGRLKLGLHAEFTRYGLRRDLAVPITNPSAKIPIAVRPLQQDTDLGPLFSFDGPPRSGREAGSGVAAGFRRQRRARRLCGGRPTQRDAVLRAMAFRVAE